MMRAATVILDTNALLQGIARPTSPCRRILVLAQRRSIIPVLSTALLREYRTVLLHPKLRERMPSITREIVDLTLESLWYLGEKMDVSRIRFSYARDPSDEHLLALAIASQASALVTMDADLLSLARSRSDVARRFRQRARHTQIVTPAEFLDTIPRP